MDRCMDVTTMRRAPVGRCCASRAWLYFYPTPDLCGFAAWGRLDADAMRGLVDAMTLGLDQAPHGVLVDVRRLEAVDADAFALLQTHVRTRDIGRSVLGTAIVRSATMGGAIATGF